jgi:hypothetical protein
MNEEGLLGPSVPDGYTKLCLVREFYLVGILLPLVDSLLDLIHYRYVRDGRSLLAVLLLALLIFQASGDCLACTHLS